MLGLIGFCVIAGAPYALFVTKGQMIVNDIARCAGPDCRRPLTRRATGRPARYCGAQCRKAAQRERNRRADAEQRLAPAQAAAVRARQHLEEHVDSALDRAAAVVELAAGHDQAKLARMLAAYRAEANSIEIAAIKLFEATALAARLTYQVY